MVVQKVDRDAPEEALRWFDLCIEKPMHETRQEVDDE